MFELILAGGWIMAPIVICSILALTIVVERFWTLREKKIAPPNLVDQIIKLHQKNRITNEAISKLNNNSPLGRILAAGLRNMNAERELMKESIEEEGRQVVLELERFLNTLGTIASITPLLGLLGTVIGMIKVFAVITSLGVGDPSVLADGISQALLTTAAGLSVAIPSVMFYRFFRGRVDELLLKMEAQAVYLVEVVHGDRPRIKN
ncbi:MAG: MotA/TolQ/ExbB proton channel family protein [gamma proteobacterium symbiont of Lucinoma myriamae]|nr:MotA/TolQ/ExbB proton channel family protein [gamma proteobacterium symbiont of Lucinoma myriamae]MCU7819452.1 MotA/TolQ/ExbB proton channel family protein [gamma proteobacterium symbiont of Lucinoma myriamae]MCU7832994.1 MotA/TolQ/ExbB proton channel family protein [gamma proteobacterium symbiont of Lucinoma myriamae]